MHHPRHSDSHDTPIPPVEYTISSGRSASFVATLIRRQQTPTQAMKLIDAGTIELEPNTAYVVEEECSGCKTCLTMCPYNAILRDEVKQKAYINEALCKECGTCVATCPSGAIKQNLFEDEMIYSEIDSLLNDLAAVEEGGIVCQC